MDVEVAGRPGQQRGEAREVGDLHLDALLRQRDGAGGQIGDEGGGEPPVVARPDPELMRPVGHAPPDLPVVARRGVPSGDQDLDVVGHPLDLFEDVRAEQDRPALLAHPADEVHQVEPLPRIHAVERLVQQQHLRVVDEGRGDLHALPHALGVRLDAAAGRLRHLHQVEGPAGRVVGGRQAVQPGRRQHELPAGEEAVHGLLLGHQADLPVDVVVVPDLPAVQGRRAVRRREESGHHVQQRRLAGAVRAEQAGDAGPDRHRDVVDRHDVAVPAGDLGEFQHALAGGHGGLVVVTTPPSGSAGGRPSRPGRSRPAGSGPRRCPRGMLRRPPVRCRTAPTGRRRRGRTG